MKYLEYIVHVINVGVVLHFRQFLYILPSSTATYRQLDYNTAYSNLSCLRVDAHHSLMVDAKLAMFNTFPRKH